ncbi:thiamine phosphate synthase [Parvibium lacunae]|uniref:Thiamine-phosphate synthase n=1 Tax=Parvibium lacunae TaxID=1888893 RepID=A0A368L4L8_9BURK|nr:thiamine phosphate synthase [Parvibium lacunae]RCS58531.1 thiamine phosphate synthase [Parvibium lacunae]
MRQFQATAIQGLYAITPDIATAADADVLFAHLDAYLTAGGRLLQWRNKQLPPLRQEQLARECQRLCQAHHACFIINDNLALAQKLNADGLHVGQTDGDLPTIRRAWSGLLGISCYDSLPLAQEAVQLGADYIAFGAVYASPTKPLAKTAALSLFQASANLGVPRVAIGGITHAHLPALRGAGADATAVISALFDLSAPPTHTAAQTRAWCAAWDNCHEPKQSVPTRPLD